MQNKYKLTDETQTLPGGTVLHRIVALRDGPWGLAGTKGGWVEKEENLSQDGDCWISDEAWVYGNAKVYGSAWVFENARVSGNANVYEKARVSGDAWVYDNAKVYGNAKVFENARVSGNANVYEKARVSGNAEVYENAFVYGNAKVSGDAWVCGIAKVFEDQKLNGECWLNGDEPESQKFRFNNPCVCTGKRSYLEQYKGKVWWVTRVRPGWVEAKHGEEHVAFRNEWLEKV